MVSFERAGCFVFGWPYSQILMMYCTQRMPLFLGEILQGVILQSISAVCLPSGEASNAYCPSAGERIKSRRRFFGVLNIIIDRIAGGANRA